MTDPKLREAASEVIEAFTHFSNEDDFPALLALTHKMLAMGKVLTLPTLTPEQQDYVPLVVGEIMARSSVVFGGNPTYPQMSVSLPVGTKLYAAIATSASAAGQETLTDTHIQTVPDKCDRIVWRGAYYQLPIAMPKQEVGLTDDLTQNDRGSKRAD